ncbi:MAG: hypothetical protein IJN48_01725 [Clostridia bacterium]|nr:hypothetical protein [Clostridia bacterium]
MEKVEIKALTKKDVRNDVLKKLGFTAALHFGSFVCFSLTVALWVYVIVTLMQRHFEEGNKIAFIGAVVFFIMLVYLLVGLVYQFCKFFVAVAGVFTVLTSGFNIVEDTLVNSDSEEYSSLKRHATFLKSRNRQYTDGYETVMYFHKYGREVLSEGEWISTDYGDIFYLAVIGKKNRIVKSYNTKEYEIIQ